MGKRRLTYDLAAIGRPAGAIGIVTRTRHEDEIRDALAILYRKQFDKFARVAVAMLGDRDAASDAVQEAFARALTNRLNFRRASNLDTWVWRILVNVCRDVGRRRARELRVAVEAPESTSESGSDTVDIRAAIRRLPERQRLVLFLRHYADLDYRSIAVIAGIERGTVAATLNAARASLAATITNAPQ